MNTDFLQFILPQLLGIAPYLLIYGVCLICAFCLRARAPKAALLAMAGSAVLLVVTFLGALAMGYFIYLQVAQGMSSRQMGYLHGGLGIVRALGYGIGFGLMFGAVFTGRKTPAQSPQPPLHK